MKRFSLSILLTLLMSMMGINAFAADYDIAVENADGMTIYYSYINDGTELAVAPKVGGSPQNISAYQGDLVIPEEVSIEGKTYKVTTIGEYAFNSCNQLTSVIIPNSVTTINGYAFQGSGLKSITIPNSVTTVKGRVFQSCSSLASVTIPNSVTTLGEGAFYKCI